MIEDLQENKMLEVLEVEQVVDEQIEEVVEDVVNEVADTPDENIEEVQGDEIEISIAGESLTQEKEEAPSWVKELRKTNREQQKQIKEYETRLQQKEAVKPLGEKPTLEGFDYDSDKYESALDDWFTKKRESDAIVAQQREAQEKENQTWQGKLERYATAKSELKVKDYEDVEHIAQNLLSDAQQGILIQGAENPVLLVYAIGKNPKRAETLSKITDPIEFAFAVARLEKDLKVTERKPTTAPERSVGGTGRSSGALDTTLEKLRAKAEKTGNYTEVIRYKQSKQI